MLDGIAIAGEIKAEVAAQVQALGAQGIRPGLAVILVGAGTPAAAPSEMYVRSKIKTCAELSIFSEMLTPPETITTDELLQMVAALNARQDIDGILIQLPLPRACRHQAPARSRRPRQGRRRLPPRQRWPPAERSTRPATLHPRRRHGDAAPPQHPRRRQKRRRPGPQ